MRHVLALDEGTTGVTALVLDEGGKVRGRSSREVKCLYPRPGWVEQDASQLWNATLAAARAALRSARVGRPDAVGITNQRETTILWDRATGEPVAPAIVWQDRRTAARLAELKPDWEGFVRKRTGLVLDPYFCASKLEWLLRRPSLRRRAAAGRLAFGTVDSWLAWKLTGRHVTDPTNASRTLLWDIRKGEWDAELLDLFGVPEAVLPEVVPSAGVVGEAPALRGAPVASLVGDQQSALVGQGCTRAGEAKCTYGTGAFLLQHTGAAAVESRHGLLTTRAASLDGKAQFALEGSVFVAGAAVQWLRDGLRILRDSPEIDQMATQVPDAGGVVVVPAFTGLGAPHWDPDARGAVLGLTRGSDRRHLAHATLESIAFQCAEVVFAMEADAGKRIPRLRVDGGAARSRPLLQMQADLLRRPVARPANVETTALGAGLLAGLATGLWDARRIRERGDALVVRPKGSAAQAKRRMERWAKAAAAVRAFGK